MHLLDFFSQDHQPTDVPPPFIRAIEEIGDVRILRLQGDVGAAIGPQVTERNRVGQSGGVFERPVVIDFAGTTGADFSTVSYLVDALRRRTRSGQRVALINVPALLIAELEIARLKDRFPVYASEAEALRALRAPGA
jgi:anti-anti-sigma regulatory factor